MGAGTLILLILSHSAWAQFDDGAQAVPDTLDRIVIQLEQDRLLDESGIEPLQGGFAAHFFLSVYPVLKAHHLSAQDLENKLRRWNTGMHLIAVDREFADRLLPDLTVCIVPFGTSSSRIPEYWIFLSAEGPEALRTFRREFRAPSETMNRAKLGDSGMLSICQNS